MELPLKRTFLRKILLVLWFPSITVCIFATGLLIMSEGQQPTKIFAIDNLSDQSASLYAAAPPQGSVLGDSIVSDTDDRVAKVASFLARHNSPMVGSASTFVSVADKYDLDWRLLVAIAGKESSFGKHIPPGSYNAWGWGIPTGAQRGIGFSSWDQGIETVARGLRVNYFDRGYNTLLKIESRYTPPSAKSNHHWVTGVSHFMAELEQQ